MTAYDQGYDLYKREPNVEVWHKLSSNLTRDEQIDFLQGYSTARLRKDGYDVRPMISRLRRVILPNPPRPRVSPPVLPDSCS